MSLWVLVLDPRGVANLDIIEIKQNLQCTRMGSEQRVMLKHTSIAVVLKSTVSGFMTSFNLWEHVYLSTHTLVPALYA